MTTTEQEAYAQGKADYRDYSGVFATWELRPELTGGKREAWLEGWCAADEADQAFLRSKEEPPYSR